MIEKYNPAELAKYTLALHEGRRNTPYLCSTGKLTVGIGRNIEDIPFRDDEIDLMFWNDLQGALSDAKHLFGSWSKLNAVRQTVLLDMAFNMGRHTLAKFEKFRAAVDGHQWVEAAEEMLDSRWARQVGARAERLARWMKTGKMTSDDYDELGIR